MTAILCARPTCTRAFVQTCPECEDRLCAVCWGAGTSSKCNKCFTRTKANA